MGALRPNPFVHGGEGVNRQVHSSLRRICSIIRITLSKHENNQMRNKFKLTSSGPPSRVWKTSSLGGGARPSHGPGETHGIRWIQDEFQQTVRSWQAWSSSIADLFKNNPEMHDLACLYQTNDLVNSHNAPNTPDAWILKTHRTVRTHNASCKKT